MVRIYIFSVIAVARFVYLFMCNVHAPATESRSLNRQSQIVLLLSSVNGQLVCHECVCTLDRSSEPRCGYPHCGADTSPVLFTVPTAEEEPERRRLWMRSLRAVVGALGQDGAEFDPESW